MQLDCWIENCRNFDRRSHVRRNPSGSSTDGPNVSSAHTHEASFRLHRFTVKCGMVRSTWSQLYDAHQQFSAVVERTTKMCDTSSSSSQSNGIHLKHYERVGKSLLFKEKLTYPIAILLLVQQKATALLCC